MRTLKLDRHVGTSRRFTLLILVYGASVMLVALTGVALVALVSGHVTSTAIDSSVSSDRSLVRSFIVEDLRPSDIAAEGPDAVRVAQVQQGLAALIDPSGNGILQVKIYSTDGRILYSDRPELRGRPAGDDDELTEAIGSGQPVATVIRSAGTEAATVGAATPDALEEYLPILDANGRVQAVFEVYRNAAPILASVDATRRDVLLVTVAAGFVLAILLQLIFRAAQRRLTRQTAELVEAGRRDALTGLLNHGSIVTALTEELEAVRVSGGSVGIAIIDIDNFRLLNTAHGHAAGDKALREVASILGRELSESSTLGRFGPDEFLAIAPPSCVHDLEPAIGRLRERLIDLSLQFGASERLPVTISAGVCFAPVDGDAATELLSVATVTLGEAKASGGDAVRLAADASVDRRSSAQNSFDVLQGLVIAVDTKDRYTKRHSEDVARYALFIADRIDLDPEVRRTLGTAGLLHDVGKIGIPDTILRKPAALTDEEYAIVKQHVALGDMIVRDLPNLDLVRAGIRHHHERWDGTGYLDGLAGEAIPLIARILAVADAFSAMTTTRPYRKALDVREAIRRLEDAADSQLDARLVKAFVTGLESAPDAPLPGMARPTPLIWTPQTHVA
jgi:diguanylate cyclase (GGDEF)-like protein